MWLSKSHLPERLVMTKTTSEKTHAATADAVIFGFWGEHPGYPSADWREAVANGDTRSGYWDWAADNEEAAQNAEACGT